MGVNLKKLVIIGSGGHAFSLLELLKDYAFIEGYVDVNPNPLMQIKYLGNDDFFLEHYSPNEFEIALGLVYIGKKANTQLRNFILNKFYKYSARTIIADSAYVSSNCQLDNGVIVFEKALVNRSKIGQHCVINSGAIIEHDCIIGSNVFVGPGSIIGGGTKIENNVFIGSGAIIRDGISISSNSVIGMGAVVTKDISISGTYIGNPAKIRL